MTRRPAGRTPTAGRSSRRPGRIRAAAASSTRATDETKPCTTGTDCSSGVCGPDKLCKSPTASDFVKNGDETDIDCGGTIAKPCDPEKACKVAKDCSSGVRPVRHRQGVPRQERLHRQDLHRGQVRRAEARGRRAQRQRDGRRPRRSRRTAGRRFRGADPFGHLDMAGNVYEFARDGYIVSGSWENHTPTNGGTAATNEVWRRYYAFGGRCGHR